MIFSEDLGSLMRKKRLPPSSKKIVINTYIIINLPLNFGEYVSSVFIILGRKGDSSIWSSNFKRIGDLVDL